MTKIAGSGPASGSISQRHGSPDPDPNPYQNVINPEPCFLGNIKNASIFMGKKLKRNVKILLTIETPKITTKAMAARPITRTAIPHWGKVSASSSRLVDGSAWSWPTTEIIGRGISMD